MIPGYAVVVCGIPARIAATRMEGNIFARYTKNEGLNDWESVPDRCRSLEKRVWL